MNGKFVLHLHIQNGHSYNLAVSVPESKCLYFYIRFKSIQAHFVF